MTKKRNRLEDRLYNLVFLTRQAFENEYNYGLGLHALGSADKRPVLLKLHNLEGRIKELLQLYFRNIIDIDKFNIDLNLDGDKLDVLLIFPIIGDGNPVSLNVNTQNG